MIVKAADDFKRRSLNALPTLLERLAYICSLQMADGTYSHWGLTRTFGARAAQEAVRLAHVETAAELVREPIREIFSEYQYATSTGNERGLLRAESFVLNAPVNDDGLLGAHLRLLQNSVQALARQGRTTPQVA
jgi:hypothetical protein